jgi:glycogen operon protein
MEWNGRYRDSIRRFVRGDAGLIAEVATRIAGSSDLYQGNLRHPINSINFITCHDGFTLADLVSYDHKHNAANHEGNRDGCNHNLSWSCGHEGPTDDPAIRTLRRRQAKNFTALLLLSQGIPMLLGGDELLRSAEGNNNTWCQDNPLGWIDWSVVETHADMQRFVAGLIRLRKRHRSLRRRHFLTDADIRWNGPLDEPPGWHDPEPCRLALTLRGVDDGEPSLHLILNAAPKASTFVLPTASGGPWGIAVDTAAPSPRDVVEPEHQRRIGARRWRVGGHSLLVLEGHPAG